MYIREGLCTEKEMKRERENETGVAKTKKKNRRGMNQGK